MSAVSPFSRFFVIIYLAFYLLVPILLPTAHTDVFASALSLHRRTPQPRPSDDDEEEEEDDSEEWDDSGDEEEEEDDGEDEEGGGSSLGFSNNSQDINDGQTDAFSAGNVWGHHWGNPWSGGSTDGPGNSVVTGSGDPSVIQSPAIPSTAIPEIPKTLGDISTLSHAEFQPNHLPEGFGAIKLSTTTTTGALSATQTSTTASATSTTVASTQDTYPFKGADGTCYGLKHVSNNLLFSRCANCIPSVPNSVVSKETSMLSWNWWCPHRLNATAFTLRSKDANLLLSVKPTVFQSKSKARALTLEDSVVDEGSVWTWVPRTGPGDQFGLRLLSDPLLFVGVCNKCDWLKQWNGGKIFPDALMDPADGASIGDMSFTVITA